MPISPPDEALKGVLKSLRADHPTLGAAKLQTLLLTQHPDWTVSEKRVKKLLAEENLLLVPPPPKSGKPQSDKDPSLRPTSRVIENLDVSQLSKKIKVVDYGSPKGKGLVATAEIKAGEDVWKEDPFVVAPDWDIFDLQSASRACGHCTTPLNDTLLASSLPCPSTASAAAAATFCPVRFCNRLCLSRSSRVHPLLCPSSNPASIPLLQFVRRCRWMAAHAVALCTARVLLSHEQGRAKELEEDRRFLDALAEMGMEERWKVSGNAGVIPDRETWRTAYTLTVQAFQDPPTPQGKKRLSKVLKKPVPENLAKNLFDFEIYLRALTRMSLNLEAHGGIYVLHSHLNHACNPNLSVRHLDLRTALARITVRAKQDIEPGEELTITYVDPTLPLKKRRQELRAWAFGECTCERCVQEEGEVKEGRMNVEVDVTDAGERFPGLEEELRHGLGLL